MPTTTIDSSTPTVGVRPTAASARVTMPPMPVALPAPPSLDARGEERQQRREAEPLEQAREHQGAEHQRALRGIGAAEGSE